MDSIFNYIGTLLWSGWTGLLDYLAAHVLLCLVPAFIIAGFMSSMIPKEAITRYLGPKASKWISYPASALSLIHISEPTRLLSISYAVFCLKKKTHPTPPPPPPPSPPH